MVAKTGPVTSAAKNEPAASISPSDPQTASVEAAASGLQRVVIDPRGLTPPKVTAIQRRYGNRAAARVIQTRAKGGEAAAPSVAQHSMPPNPTGLPDSLKNNAEQQSGLDLSDVRVHYNSSQPVQLQALAYTQGTEIHVGPGQEKHLPHEVWHVVQQKQGRVPPSTQLKGQPLNADRRLEREADQMGADITKTTAREPIDLKTAPSAHSTQPIQRLTGYEIEARIPIYGAHSTGEQFVVQGMEKGYSKALGYFLFGGLQYGLPYGEEPLGHFSISADHNEIQDAHQKLVDLLCLAGYLHPGLNVELMSSIEYITPARDETQRSGKKWIERDVNAVKEHLRKTYGQAKKDGVSPLEFTADPVLTGVPRKELRQWIEANGGDWSLFEPAVQEIEAKITDQLYLQQTTGVLPGDLSGMYQTASEKLKQTDSPPGDVMGHVLDVSKQIAENAWGLAFSENSPPKAFSEQKQTVVSYLTYLANYLMADSLSLTTYIPGGSVDKNLFAFLPRVSLQQSFQALPPELQTEQTGWMSLLDPLLEAAREYGSAYWATYKKLKPQPPSTGTTTIFKEGRPLKQEESPESQVREVLGLDDEGEEVNPDARENTRQILTALFQSKDPREPYQRPLPSLDMPHSAVYDKTKQKGIGLEDRYFQEKQKHPMSIDTFGEAITTTFQESQDRLLGHVPDLKGNIRSESEQEIDFKPAVQKRIEALRARLTVKNPNDIKAAMESARQALELNKQKAGWAGKFRGDFVQELEKIKKEYEPFESAHEKLSEEIYQLEAKIEKLTRSVEPTPELQEGVQSPPENGGLQNLTRELQSKKETQVQADALQEKLEKLESRIESAGGYIKDLAEGSEKIEKDLSNLDTLLGEVLKTAKLVTESEKTEEDLLKFLHAKALEVQHTILKLGHQEGTPAGDDYLVLAQNRVLNADELGIARKKHNDIKEKLKKKPQTEVQKISDKADAAYKKFKGCLSRLSLSQMEPKQRGGIIAEMNQHKKEYLELVSRAGENAL